MQEVVEEAMAEVVEDMEVADIAVEVFTAAVDLAVADLVEVVMEVGSVVAAMEGTVEVVIGVEVAIEVQFLVDILHLVDTVQHLADTVVCMLPPVLIMDYVLHQVGVTEAPATQQVEIIVVAITLVYI